MRTLKSGNIPPAFWLSLFSKIIMGRPDFDLFFPINRVFCFAVKVFCASGIPDEFRNIATT